MSTQFTEAQWFSKEKVINNENFDKKTISYGYYLGFNSYDFNLDYFEDQKVNETRSSSEHE